MVQIPWLYRNMHAKHHSKRVQRATEALRLSLGDEILDVACSIAALVRPTVACALHCYVVGCGQHMCSFDRPTLTRNSIGMAGWLNSEDSSWSGSFCRSICWLHLACLAPVDSHFALSMMMKCEIWLTGRDRNVRKRP